MPPPLLGQQLLLDPIQRACGLVAQDDLPRPSRPRLKSLLGKPTLVRPFKFPASPYEYAVTALRECPTPDALQLCDTPDKAAEYWRRHIPANPYFNPEVECFAVFLQYPPPR